MKFVIYRAGKRQKTIFSTMQMRIDRTSEIHKNTKIGTAS